VHTHLLLSDARALGNRCCIISAKGGEKKRKSVCFETDDRCRVEIMDESSPWMVPGFTPGTEIFILADISGGVADGMRGPGLVLYSSPNQNLMNRQIMKQDARRLGYPLLTKDQLCRYTNDRMNEVFERYGGLARLVWGNVMDETAHKSRLIDNLQDVDGFLSILNQHDYLKGPHCYFYMELQQAVDGTLLFDLDKFRPTVVPAPRYVIKMVAGRVVKSLLQPSLESDFGKLHKAAIDGILFEEVCLYANNIELKVSISVAGNGPCLVS